MSILFKPPLVNTSADPGLEYLLQREISDAFGSVTGTSSTNVHNTGGVVLEQITSIVTNVTQINPAETVLDLTNLSYTDVELTKDQLTYSIITADPHIVDRTLTLPQASDVVGHRFIMINRSTDNNVIVIDKLVNTIVVVESQSSEEVLSDGYNWVAVN
jgi:hypothetical protein